MNDADRDLVLVECKTDQCTHKFDIPFDAYCMMNGAGTGGHCGGCGENNGFKAVQDPSPTATFAPLLKVVRELAGCNGLFTKNIWEWPEDIGFDLEQLNKEAERLSADEIQTFVDGDECVANQLAAKYEICALHKFLNEVFDGYLHDKIIIIPELRKREEITNATE